MPARSVVVLTHLLAIYATLAAPWLGCMWYRKARLKLAAGLSNAKLRMYQEVVAEQIVTTGAVLALWRFGLSPARNLGLVLPRSLTWNVLPIMMFLASLMWSSLRMRPKAEKIRKQLEGSVGALIPTSHAERFWFGMVSVGAGVSEELVFRGFLLYYFAAYLPQLNTPERVLLCTFSFGFAHIYQGWKGALGAGTLGLILVGLYLLTGSLLAPVIVHAAVDWRVLLIFPPEEPQASEAAAV